MKKKNELKIGSLYGGPYSGWQRDKKRYYILLETRRPKLKGSNNEILLVYDIVAMETKKILAEFLEEDMKLLVE